MKGFKPTGKGPRAGHSFSSDFGFSGSTGKSMTIGPYTRKPAQFKKGGKAHKVHHRAPPPPAAGALDQVLAAAAPPPQQPMPSPQMAPPAMGGMKKGGKMKKYARGGDVNGHSEVQRKEPVTEFDKEHGGKTPLRPGFKRGGPSKKALGGPVAMRKGGKHGGFDRKPMFGGHKG